MTIDRGTRPDPGAGRARPDRLALVLRPFARVEPGEGGTVLLLMAALFLLLTSYYLLKTVREPLVLVSGGAEVKSYASAVQTLLLLLIVPTYSALVNRVGRVRLINRIGLFFVGNIALFYALARLDVPYLGVPFFIWVGIFSLMVISQLWSFANDLYTPEQGKRLFALIAIGSSVGAIAGAWFAGWLLDAGIGVHELMLIAAVALLASVAITAVVQRRERARLAAVAANRRLRPLHDESARSGFALVLRSRYLLLIGLMLLVLNLVNSTGEYILGRTVRQAAAVAVPAGTEAELNAFVGSFYAHYFTLVNVLAAALQFFVVSRAIGWLGVRGAILVLPVLALAGYAVLAAAPALLLIRLVKAVENATDYSLQNTVRHALFLPTPAEIKYKGKQAVDTFFVRAGDVASAGVVVGGTAVGLSTQAFAVVNAAFVAVWLALSVAVGRRHHAMRRARRVEAVEIAGDLRKEARM
ncbi:MAG TPA: Npt1/Npt2 family nucleotide transporter [Candidatus Krumholzibacteria bacterium]|nr:Npt1/Npt2 family nucleotide transporter [Candidatus Krumholzibacteria bacterium]HPD71968.1 Npt1/Npt2 family nucleotide transporter [Candidatus Krumholzibacteria bacterium]HRY41099.1 Npt1/Npt2 family nucleotide transporter [Candidatus Krumholzibacteria bacterium]